MQVPAAAALQPPPPRCSRRRAAAAAAPPPRYCRRLAYELFLSTCRWGSAEDALTQLYSAERDERRLPEPLLSRHRALQPRAAALLPRCAAAAALLPQARLRALLADAPLGYIS